MPQQRTRADLATFFENGDVPNEDHFKDLFESFYSKLEDSNGMYYYSPFGFVDPQDYFSRDLIRRMVGTGPVYNSSLGFEYRFGGVRLITSAIDPPIEKRALTINSIKPPTCVNRTLNFYIKAQFRSAPDAVYGTDYIKVTIYNSSNTTFNPDFDLEIPLLDASTDIDQNYPMAIEIDPKSEFLEVRLHGFLSSRATGAARVGNSKDLYIFRIGIEYANNLAP